MASPEAPGQEWGFTLWGVQPSSQRPESPSRILEEEVTCGVVSHFYFISSSFIYSIFIYIFFISLLICLETEEECSFHTLIRQCSFT